MEHDVYFMQETRNDSPRIIRAQESHVKIWRERYSGRGKSGHKEPVTETRGACLTNSEKVSVAGAQ